MSPPACAGAWACLKVLHIGKQLGDPILQRQLLVAELLDHSLGTRCSLHLLLKAVDLGQQVLVLREDCVRTRVSV